MNQEDQKQSVLIVDDTRLTIQILCGMLVEELRWAAGRSELVFATL